MQFDLFSFGCRQHKNYLIGARELRIFRDIKIIICRQHLCQTKLGEEFLCPALVHEYFRVYIQTFKNYVKYNLRNVQG